MFSENCWKMYRTGLLLQCFVLPQSNSWTYYFCPSRHIIFLKLKTLRGLLVCITSCLCCAGGYEQLLRSTPLSGSHKTISGDMWEFGSKMFYICTCTKQIYWKTGSLKMKLHQILSYWVLLNLFSTLISPNVKQKRILNCILLNIRSTFKFKVTVYIRLGEKNYFSIRSSRRSAINIGKLYSWSVSQKHSSNLNMLCVLEDKCRWAKPNLNLLISWL